MEKTSAKNDKPGKFKKGQKQVANIAKPNAGKKLKDLIKKTNYV